MSALENGVTEADADAITDVDAMIEVTGEDCFCTQKRADEDCGEDGGLMLVTFFERLMVRIVFAFWVVDF